MNHRAEMRVLIAEDESLSGATIRDAVEQCGFTPVGEAFNGYEAIAMTETLRPDVVLMDIQMPGLDGLSAAQRILYQSPTPIVILTAHNDIALIEKASAFGVGAYLLKPPNAQEIARTVAIAIARFDDMLALRDLNARLQAEVGERALIEQQLRQTVKERNLLLKEVYHRVKNNFMAVSALLELQADSVEERHTREALQESVHRVKSMSLIHERLYQSQTLSEINFSESAYIIATELFHTYQPQGSNILLDISRKPVMLPAEQAIPCALLLNELVSNALKYAFPGGRNGTIRIDIRDVGDEVFLTVNDNGVGLPNDFDIQRTSSLGIRLVAGFIQQLHGSCTLNHANGTQFDMTFPKNASAC
ncbi:response regulator receiver sensor signal transduction histidine kinase [Candidatus Moduliflexus flocculans]|uniref:Response regulator receiver sensor signal transduction histidine kinase n=1 Tax=Candidatus Moduliflexus flocculans TaxID=1499966 RepID=A0A0S6W0C2_9BACT|nr:response regulator receiver sensor signal transduction histidine kinase [Candidatus Moduliflexus flocculans]